MLSICFPYPDENEEIRKVFLEFLEREMITGSEVGNAILIFFFLFFFDKKGIDIKKLKGQCYDRVPNTQSEKVVVSSTVLNKSPKDSITHCWYRNLNLSIAQCTNIQFINNTIEQYKALQIYFHTSSKKKSLLEHIESLHLHYVCQQKVLIGMSSTKWSERHVSYEHFYLASSHVAQTFEVINGAHPELRSFKKIYIDS